MTVDNGLKGLLVKISRFNPVRELAVPCAGMSSDKLFILLGKLYNLLASSEVENTTRRFGRKLFQTIINSHTRTKKTIIPISCYYSCVAVSAW